MTLDAHQSQAAAVGWAYAIAFLERMPSHWIRPGLLYDLHAMLEARTTNRDQR
jgi:hypothetical protein